MRISRAQALSWRMGRHFLTGGADTAEDVVARLGAVPAVSGDADLAVRRRMTDSAPGEVARALESGRLMKTYAFGGATYLMDPARAGRYLALRAAGRMWERSSWIGHYRLEPEDWPPLREIVRGLVADGPITREQLIAGVTAHARFAHLGPGLAHTGETLLKPFAWQGDLCFGPGREGVRTFQSPAASPTWSAIPGLEDAGPAAVAAYFDAYGPATLDHAAHWLGSGLGAGRRRITAWVGDLAGKLAEVTVAGEPMLVSREHLDGLDAQAETTAVTLLPGHDQWVLGPGTADERIVPAQRRKAVTRGANLVLATGVVSGTWKAGAETLAVSWFAEAGGPPRGAIESEAARLAALLGRDLTVAIDVT
ncbi:crosslink repair DNA glycosylase YcaQ family protein [Phytomonospora sp. NPDC050363]|uniref:DNA glycosylase AlkZ-like family protein n=1 Tax=Phytomonospora sp. NPDC050363 TaxID=3155642 RepID=UPI0033DCA8B5